MSPNVPLVLTPIGFESGYGVQQVRIANSFCSTKAPPPSLEHFFLHTPSPKPLPLSETGLKADFNSRLLMSEDLTTNHILNWLISIHVCLCQWILLRNAFVCLSYVRKMSHPLGRYTLDNDARMQVVPGNSPAGASAFLIDKKSPQPHAARPKLQGPKL